MNNIDRRQFFFQLITMCLSANAIGKISPIKLKSPMPVLFCGHGSPMNALAHNDFTQSLFNLSQSFNKPKAILVISAHWITNGTFVTAMKKPKTIHDFDGFPKELFAVEYKANGSPEVAQNIVHKILEPKISADSTEWGLDHGTWSILKHLYPKANVPVLQLSIDKTKSVEFYYDLGQKLRFLREQGILIIGSGNLVHNLDQVNFDEKAKPFNWAIEFDQWLKEKILKKDNQALIHDFYKSKIGQMSHPTIDHYIPFLFSLGASLESDKVEFAFEGIQNASISMRTIKWS